MDSDSTERSESDRTRRLLIIMRHAKSDWGSGALRDFDRPLNARGESDAPRMGHWLRAQRLVPQQLISSPAVRAAETAHHVARGLGLDRSAIAWDRRIYEATVDDLLDVLGEGDETAAITMLVGHNPGLEELARHLIGPDTLPQQEKLLPTAGVVAIELPNGFKKLTGGEGKCVGHMRPRWLKD